MSELKPCPFCGSTDIAANSFAIEASVRCFDCFAVLVRKHPRNTDGGLAAVIEAWNTRATDALLREAVAVLERCPPTSNPTLSAEYHLERINAWWRLDVRPALAKIKGADHD